MTSVGSWDELFDEAEAEHFIGREHEIDNFDKQLSLTHPRYLIFYITGQGGVGKTTLLNRFREIARDEGFLLTDSDELQQDIPTLLGRFAHQLAEQGSNLKHFDELYKIYQQKMHEIENDPEAPPGLATLLAKVAVRSAYIVGDMVPGVRKGLEYIPRESVETHAGEWAAYLAKKLTNKDEVALVRNPVPVLTTLFFEDLNEIAQKGKVLLCFDNFEATRHYIQPWLLRLREYRPSLNIRIAIAGRDQPGAQWDTLRNITMTFALDVFTSQEAETFLDACAITNSRRRKEILEWSGRLPLFMSWLAAPEGVESDSEIPIHDIVERFLRWITQPSQREAALLAAIPRQFNLDILQQLLNMQEFTMDATAIFDWLQTMPFVQSRSDGWYYHAVVRRMMLHYQRQKSPHTYQQIHTTLASFYNTKRGEFTSLEKAQWTSIQWRKNTLAYLYHYLAADPVLHWEEVISVFALAIHQRLTFAMQIIELLSYDDVRDELSHEQNSIVQLFKLQLQSIREKDITDGFVLFDKLCSMEKLHPQAKGYALTYRGICYRLNKDYKKSLGDLEEASHLIPDDAWIIAHKGVTYFGINNYTEALKALDQAIDLNNKDSWIIINRGRTYQKMKRYKKALADFNKAIDLNKRDGHAFTHRGAVYRDMGLYEKALQDFEQAIALGQNDSWLFTQRAETYRKLHHYEKALADYERAIMLNPQDSHAFAHRGWVYSSLKRYEEALADFAQSILLNNQENCAFLHRAEMYKDMGHYEKALEALADYEQITAFDAKKFKDVANSIGLLYSYLGQYEKAADTFQREIEEAPDDFRAQYNLAVASARWKGIHKVQPQIDQTRTMLQHILDTEARGAVLYGLGGLEAITGNTEQALNYLEQALPLEPLASDWASSDVAWLDVRTHPRFQALIAANAPNAQQ